jgi:hypothetical protein
MVACAADVLDPFVVVAAVVEEVVVVVYVKGWCRVVTHVCIKRKCIY